MLIKWVVVYWELDLLGGKRRGWVGVLDSGGLENRQKTGPKIVFSGAPGRGVLRFLAEAYRNPVHFLPIFAFFSQN